MKILITVVGPGHVYVKSMIVRECFIHPFVIFKTIFQT